MPAPGAYPVGSTTDGRVRWSDGSVTGNSSTKQGYVSNSAIPKKTTATSGNYRLPAASTTTSGGGGGGGQVLGSSTSSSSSLADDLRDQAERERQARIERNRQIAESYKGYAGQLRTSAQSVLDNFLKSLTGFREKSTGLLQEERDDAFNTAESLTGQQRRNAADIELMNKRSARSQGIGNSSYFDEIIQKGRENLGRQFGTIGLERGANEREAQRRYQDRYDESTQLEQGAQGTYADAVNRADLIERAAGIDFEGDTNATTSAFENMLANARSVQSLLSNFSNQIPTAEKTAIDTSGLMQALGGLSLPTLGGGAAANASAIADANPVAPQTYEEILRQQRLASLYGRA